MNRAFSKIWILIILIAIAGGGFFAWQYFGVPKEEIGKGEVAEDETARWKTYRNKEYGFEMKYPEGFFPLVPKAEVIQCDYANFADKCLLSERITINNVPFCREKVSGAGLGTTYITHYYTTVIDKECFVVSFTVPYPNCSNLLPIKSQEIQEAYDKCKLDNEVTKPETINQILSTFKFIK